MKIKEKYIIMAAVLGICTAGIAGNSVLAADTLQESSENQDNIDYPDLGTSEEEQVYRGFLESGEAFSDVKNLGKVMYAVYDIDQDNIKELIIRGIDSELVYRYLFYQYKDGKVETVGSVKNWQSAGNGELYYSEKINAIAVDMNLADHKSYTLYKLDGTMKHGMSFHKQSLDVQGSDGNYQREYDYSITDKDGNESDKTLTEDGWTEFEDSLEEIPFYDLEVKANTEFTQEQIDTLKKSLGVPDEVTVARCVAGDPWYWEGAGCWIVDIELHDEDDVFLAGAAIDPDTLELQREIAPYDAGRVASAKGQNSESASQSTNAPFYGIWCYGGKSEEEAESYAQTMRNNGYEAKVFVTTDWSNLNPEKFYVVTAGVYMSESDANAALPSVQSFYADAYVKYSGDYQG